MKNNILVPVVGLLLVGGVAGFVFFQQKASPSVTPEIKKAQEAAIANCKYDPDFCKYAANGIVAMAKGYTMTSESITNGQKTKMVMKTDGKENSETITYTDGKETGSFISLDKTTYMKDSKTNEWTEFPPSKDEMGKPTSNLFDFDGLKKELGDVAKEAAETLNVKRVGTEACGNKTCAVFEMSEKMMNSTTKIWIDTSEHLARKMEMNAKEGVTTMTFEYGPVSITKPSPVKKMPAFDTMMKDAGVNLNEDEIKKMMQNLPQTDTQESPEVEETPTE